MDFLTRDNIRSLADARHEICVSITMPTWRTGRETEQGPIRLKNLLRRAEKDLLGAGRRDTDIRALLEPAEALLANVPFWQHQADGLAVFLSPDGLVHYRLPQRFDELVVTGDRFHVKPLLALFAVDGRFFVLALSQNAVRLLQCTRYSAAEVPLPEDLPASLAEALRFDDPEKQLQFHTSTPGAGGGRPAMFHGHGVVDETKVNIRRYFQIVSKGLHESFRDERAPLVLAGVDYLLPIYREVSSYPRVAEKGIEGSAERMTDETLHARGWEIVEPIFAAAQKEAAGKYELLAAKEEQATGDLDRIVTAAVGGRVETLFLLNGARKWGVHDPETGTVEQHDEARPGDEDLLDLAAIQTFLKGGSVYELEPEAMPDGSPCAAVLRY